MAAEVTAVITFALSNFSLSFLVLGLIAALASVVRAPRPITRAAVVERLLAWHVFFVVGACNLYNFVCHVFFGKISAALIGWADSPFQLEVGMASLGFSVVGFLAAFRSFDLRLAALLSSGIFLLGAAAGHIYQIATTHNFAPGNSGVVLYTDVVMPLFGLGLLWMQHKLSPAQRPDPRQPRYGTRADSA